MPHPLRMIRLSTILVAVLMSLMLRGGEPSPIIGTLTLPRHWQVCGPLDKDVTPPPDVLRGPAAPRALAVGGQTRQVVTLPVDDPFNRLDLESLLGGTGAGKVAYVFIPFMVPADTQATLGFGADWWMRVWLDGVSILDTTANGNDAWPPTAHDHLKTVPLKAGAHLLAIRFISGSGSSVLAAAGPADLRRGRPAGPLLPKSAGQAGNLIADGGFEAVPDSAPCIPPGWINGPGNQRFKAGELSIDTRAPLAGARSLVIDTRAAGAGKRTLRLPFQADVDTCYRIAFQARSIAGDGYVTVSVRDDAAGRFNTGFIRAVGADNLRQAIRKGQSGACQAYYFFDTPTPCLTIQAHGQVHAALDDLSIVAVDRGSLWKSWNEQRAPWSRDWNTLSEDVVTPHTAWARPLAGGDLAVTAILPRRKHRLTIELAQRLSMRYTPVFIEYPGSPTKPGVLGGNYWIYDGEGDPLIFDKEADTLERLARPADCIVIAEVHAAALTPRLVAAILDRVEKGAGLVFTGSVFSKLDLPAFTQGAWSNALSAANETTEETGWVQNGPASFPRYIDQAPRGFYQHGRGRIALWGGHMEDTRDSLEADLSYLIKAMLWTARRLPAVRIAGLDLPGTPDGVLRARVDRAQLPARIGVRLQTTGRTDASLDVRAWIDNYRTDGEKSIELNATDAASAASNPAFDLPRLPAGTHRVHIQVKNRQGAVEDWCTAGVQVDSAQTLQAVELDRTNRLFTAGELLTGRVRLSAPLRQGQRIEVRLTDADGRLWETRKLAGTESTLSFSLPSSPGVVVAHRVRAVLSDAGGPLAEAAAECAVVRPASWYDRFFDYQLWVIPTDSFLACQALRACGITSSFHENISPFYALNNIRGNPCIWIPDWNAAIEGDKEHAPVRNPCLNAPEFRARLAETIKKSVASKLHLAPRGFSLAHEWNCRSYGRLTGPVDVCFCPRCLESFRRFVRDEYGAVERLNAAWHTDFKDWEAVTPLVLRDAVKQGQIPRWIDHRRHVDRTLTDFLSFILGGLREQLPGAQGVLSGVRVGLTTLDSYSGVDFWRLYQDAGLAGYLDPYILSFLPPGDQRRNWLTRNQPLWHPDKNTGNEALFSLRLALRPWLNLLDGAHGFTYYEEYFFEPPDTPWHPILNADLTPGIIGPANASVAQIRTGIHRLFYEGVSRPPAIALLYSRSSEHAATAWQALNAANPLAAAISPPDQMGFYTRMLDALGYAYRMVSEDQVAGGQLEQAQCRLLILPFSQALSAGATAGIRRFANKGGIVLADIRPGMADQHGAPAAAGALDDVFGVTHETAFDRYVPAEAPVNLAVRVGDAAPTNLLPRVILGPALAVTTASAGARVQPGGTPLMLANRPGDGETLLLNFALPDLDTPALDLFSRLLSGWGLEPRFLVVPLDPALRKPAAALSRDSKEAPADAEGYSHGAGALARPLLSHAVNGRLHMFGFRYPVRRGVGYERLRVTPPAAGYIYDLRTNRLLGKKARFDFRMALEDVAVFASVPYRIGKPDLAVTASITPTGHPVLDCQARMRPGQASAERHVIQFTLRAPDGSDWRDFADTAIAEGGMARHRFELPLDAPRGRWTVEAREAISGLTDRVRVALQNVR